MKDSLGLYFLVPEYQRLISIYEKIDIKNNNNKNNNN